MLSSKIIQKKKVITKYGKAFTDLIYNTFRFPTEGNNGGVVIVGEYENMRPDSLCDRIYADQSKWDAILKYNGVSNPFSIQHGNFLYAMPHSDVDGTYINPREIQERKQQYEVAVSGILDTTSNKDNSRLVNLQNKKGELPPNISKAGDKNVKIKDGRLIFGEDVTSINKENCPVPISRSRLQKALLKDKLFL